MTGGNTKNAKISRVEPDGVVISFSGGIVKIPFNELSPEIQKKYGYDPQAAAAYSVEQREQQAALAQQNKADEQRRFEERQKYWAEHPMPKIVNERPSLGSSALDHRVTGQAVLVGRIGHVTGRLLLRLTEAAVIGQDRVAPDAEMFLSGDFPQFYDDDRVQVVGIQTGVRDSIELSSRHTLQQNVRVFNVLQITKLPY